MGILQALICRYLTFEKPEEASLAIQAPGGVLHPSREVCAACAKFFEAVDGFAVDGHTLRANFGTTKCSTSEELGFSRAGASDQVLPQISRGREMRAQGVCGKPTCHQCFNVASAATFVRTATSCISSRMNRTRRATGKPADCNWNAVEFLVAFWCSGHRGWQRWPRWERW